MNHSQAKIAQKLRENGQQQQQQHIAYLKAQSARCAKYNRMIRELAELTRRMRVSVPSNYAKEQWELLLGQCAELRREITA